MIAEDYLVTSFIASQILGDGYLLGDELRITHDLCQVDYVNWKYTIAKNIGLDPSNVYSWDAEGTFGFQTRYRFSVKNLLGNIRYLNPIELVHVLDPLGLLLWWLDDGCLVVHEKKERNSVSRFGYLGTETFDLTTNREISCAIFDRFGISSRVHIDRGGVDKNAIYYRLYLNATAMRMLIDVVRKWIPQVPSSMIYKLNMGYRPNRIKSSLEYTENYNF